MTGSTQIKPTNKPVVNPKEVKGAWRDKALNGGILLSNVLVQVGTGASIPGLRQAAMAIETILTTVEKVKANKEDFQIIADDASELIIAIWRAQEKTQNPKQWLSPEVRDMVKNLTKTLNEVNEIAKRQSNRKVMVRVVFYLADAGKIRQTRQKIDTAVQRFQIISQLKMHDLLLEVVAKQQELLQNQNEANNAEEEDEEEDSEEDEYDEEPPPPTAYGPQSSVIRDISFANYGPGRMINHGVGNIVNNTLTDIGNDHSVNYYDEPPRASRRTRRS